MKNHYLTIYPMNLRGTEVKKLINKKSMRIIK